MTVLMTISLHGRQEQVVQVHGEEHALRAQELQWRREGTTEAAVQQIDHLHDPEVLQVPEVRCLK